MEKLNIRFLQVIVAAATVAFASTAFAGPYRMSSKAPVQPKQFKGYVFGYGGWDSGADWDTNASFEDPYFNPFGYGAEGFPIDWDMNNGWTAGGGVGAYSKLLGGSRFEIEGSYTSNEVGDLKYAFFDLPADFEIKTANVMFNMLKEVPFGKRGAAGYFGGGVGYHTTKMEGDISHTLYSDSDSGFAWQLIAGVDIPVTERLALFMQYRYLVLSEMTFTTVHGDFTHITDEDTSSHAVQVGLRVSF